MQDLQASEFVFIDSNIADKQAFINHVPSNAKVIFLNNTTSAISQIVAVLSSQKNLDAIHIISHGSTGELDFSNGTLNTQNLSTYAPQLKKIGESLSKNGDILLYGCEIAKSEKGSDFVNLLAKFTHADIAASNDLTGSNALGGDWNLEIHSGKIESATLLAPDYQGLLAAPSSIKDAAGNIFLLGNNFELGISPDGNFGTSQAPPTGYFVGKTETLVGMVYNPAGFSAANNATNLDFFLPGTPFEAFSVGYTKGAGTFWGANHYIGSNKITPGGTGSLHQITNVSSTDTSTGNTLSATYVGIYNANLQVTITYSFSINDLYYSANVTLKNIGASAIDDARYLRMVNPDNTTDYTANYNTVNTILSQQPGSSASLVLAQNPTPDAYQTLTGHPTLFGYYSTDQNTRVSILAGLPVTTNNTALNPFISAYYTTAPAVGTSSSGNDTITLDYDAGALAVGASKTFVYSSLLTNDLASTIAAINSNTAPTFTGGINTGLTLAQNAAITTITNSILKVIDAEQADTLLTYTLSTLPTKGILTKNAVTLNVSDTFTQSDINGGLIKYTPTTGLSGTDNFVFTVSDGAGGTLTGQSFNFSITGGNVFHTGIPSISGTPITGQTLTAATGLLVDSNGLTNLNWQWQESSDGTNWTDIAGGANSTYVLTVNESAKLVRAKASWGSGLFAESEVSNFTSISPNLTAITTSSAVTEPIALRSTATTSTGVNIFDFTIDDGVSDILPTTVSQIRLTTSGTADFSKVNWLLSGTDISGSLAGIYNSGTNTITFSGLGISVADTTKETYTVSAYYNNNTGLTEGQTYILSLNPNSDVTVGALASSTQLQLAQSAITNGTGSIVDITATQLRFDTQPAGSLSGFALTTQPVLKATDAAGNVDANFTDTVLLSENSSGNLSGNVSLVETSGVANFNNVIYNATADHESFQLFANAAGLATGVSTAIDSNVITTKLQFLTQPIPTSIESGHLMSFSTVPTVQAVDAQNTLDTDYATNIVLSVTDPIDGVVDGSVIVLNSANDTDGNAITVTQNTSNGATTFSGLALQYTNAGSGDTLVFNATSGNLTTVNSHSLVSNTIPSVTSINRSSGVAALTNANTVNYTVTFGENVTGVDASDFIFTTSGITGASISSISGSGSTYTISVNTGFGDGTLRLDLNDNDSILNSSGIALGGSGVGNGGFSTGQSYSIDKTAPIIVIDTVAGDDKIDVVEEDNNPLTISGATIGAENGQLISVNIGGLIKTAVVSNNLWNVILTTSEVQALIDGITTISANVFDVVGNAATQVNKTIIYNKSPPISVIDSSDYAINVGETATITFTFAEVVTGFTANDVAVMNGFITEPLSTDGGMTWTAIYTPTANVESLNNLITVNNTGIQDSVGNSGIGWTNSLNYSIDTLSPTISHLARQNPSNQSTNADTLTYRITFSESVQNLDATDFYATGTTATVSVDAISATTYDVTLSGDDLATLNGNVTLSLANGQNITDSANNALLNTVPTSTNNPTYILDNTSTPPALTLFSDTGNNSADLITNNGGVNVLGIESGAMWEFSTDEGSSWTTGTGAAFSLSGDGSKSAIARQIDSFGNISANSNTLNFTLDTNVIIPTASLSVDTGNSAGDNITNNGLFQISNLETGASWEFSTDGTSWTTGSGNSFNVSGDGNQSVFVRQTDVAGNVSANSSVFNFVLDSSVVSPVLTLANDSGNHTDNITNDGTINVSNLEMGASWEFSFDGTSWTTGNGNSFNVSGDGNQSVFVRQTDLAGNLSLNQLYTFILDTLVVPLTLNLANDSGNHTDNVTNDGTINVSGLETGASWEFSFDGTSWTTGSGNSFNVSGDGNKSVFVRQTDVSGNLSASSSVFNFVLDSSVVSPVLTLANDSGNHTDNITNDGTINLSDLETGANWEFSTDGTNWTTGNGNSFNVSGDGNQSVFVRQTDLAGNLSASSSVLNFILDGSVALPVLTLANDSGNHTDNVTNHGAINVSGLETGATWEFSSDGTSWATGNGNSFVVAVDGNQSVFVRQSDLAGNLSPNQLFSFILDTLIASPTLNLANDSGNHTDNVTNDGTINVSGLEAGASWEFSYDGISWTTGSGNNFVLTGNGNKTVLVRQTDLAGNTSINDGTLNFTLNNVVATPSLSLVEDTAKNNDQITNNGTFYVSGLDVGSTWEFSSDAINWTTGSGNNFTLSGDGNYSILVRQTDVAGNLSTNSSAFNFTLDTTIAAPILALAIVGSVSNSGVIFVSGIENNATWEYSLDAGNIWITGTGNNFVLSGDGNKTVIARQTDVAGNISANNALTFTLDTTTTIPDLALVSDTGISNDNITNNGKISVSGLEAAATWEFSNDDISWITGSGNSFNVSGDGDKSVFVRQTDVAGNLSPNRLFTFTLDTQVAPPTLSLANDSGISGDNVTNNGTLNVSGLENAAFWEYSSDGIHWITGNGYNFTVSGDGNKNLIVRQTDVTGNLSANSSPLLFTLDSTTDLATLKLFTDSGQKNDDNITNDGTVVVFGLENNANWQYSSDFGDTWFTGAGNHFTLFDDGNKTVLVKQTDRAGNINLNSAILNFTLDSVTTFPLLALANDTGQKNDGITHDGSITVANLESGATWQYSTNNGDTWITGTDSRFTLNADGNKTVIVKQTDSAGNSNISAINFTLDTQAQTLVLTLAHDTGNNVDVITSDGTVTVFGLETGASWEYSSDGGDTWFTGTGNHFTLHGDGNKTTLVRQIDSAGNTTIDDATLSFVLDSTAAMPDLFLENDSGQKNDGITNDGRINVFGLEKNARWQYSTDSGNTWTIGSESQFTLLGNGNKTVIVQQIDIADNTNTNSLVLNFTLDNEVATPSLVLASDTGKNSNDKITRDGTFNVLGLEKGAQWRYSTDNGNTWLNGSDDHLTLRGDGNKTVLVQQTDLADNVSAISTPLNFQLDHLITAPILTLAFDILHTANVFGIEEGASWEFSHDGIQWTTGSGNTFTVSDNIKSVLVRQTDVAGNVSTNSVLSFAPDIPTLKLVTDSGKNADAMTNNGTVVVSNLEIDSTWQYSTDNGESWIKGSDNQFVLHDDGIKNILVKQMDSLGNFSLNSGALNFTLDTTANAPTLSLINNSGKKEDFITSDGRIVVSGLENDASWKYSTNNGDTWITGIEQRLMLHGDGIKSVMVNQTDIAGNLSANSEVLTFRLDSEALLPTLKLLIDSGKKNDNITNHGTIKVSNLETGAGWQYSTDSGNTWTTGTGNNFVLSGDGNKTILVRQTDLAGNTNINSASLNLTLDTDVTAPVLTLANDTGKYADNITFDGTIHVSGIEKGATWAFSTDGKRWTTGNGDSFTISGDGNKTVSVRQTDVAGNVSVDTSLNFTLDTSITTPMLTLITDSGKKDDYVTNDGGIDVSGLETGASWQYSTDSGNAWTTGTGNNFVLSGDGNKTILVRQTDLAGNTNINSASLNVTLNTDVTAPVLTLANDTGKHADNITFGGTIHVSGIEKGATWAFSTDGKRWTTGNGDSFTISGDGNKTVSVRQTDVAGNVSVDTSLNFTLDTDVTAPVLTLVNDTSKHDDNITFDGTIHVSGIEKGAIWAFSSDGKRWTTGNGDSFTISGDGNKTVLVCQTDVSGNLSTNHAIAFTLDKSAPILDSITRDTFDLPNDSKPFLVNVNYSDLGSGIDTKSISVGDISIFGATNFTVSKASFDGKTATYTIDAPKEGWQSTHAGTYTISINAEEVKDIAGNRLNFETAKQFDITLKNIPQNADVIANLIETDNILNVTGQFVGTTPAAVNPQTAIVGQFGTFSINKFGHWTYSTNTPHNEFQQDKIYLDTFPISTADNIKSNVIIQISGTNDLPILVDDLSKQALTEIQIGNATKNVLHGQLALQSLKGEPLLQNMDKSWADLDQTQLLFKLENSQNSGFDVSGHQLVKLTLANGSTLTLNTWEGSYAYIPSISTSTAQALDQFTITADGVPLVLALNRFDLSDLDGISPDTETQLANFATSENKPTGDLNHDGIEDKSQGAVVNIAWINYDNFQKGLVNKLDSNKAIINIAVTKNESEQVDESAQLSHITVLPSDSPNIGGQKPSGDNIQTPLWDAIEFSVSAKVDTGLTDIYPRRDGLQTQVAIDISRAGEFDFNGYMKYVSAKTIKFYNAAGNSLVTLDGEKLTSSKQAGWYDFTQRTADGDGARFIKDSQGKIITIEIVMTDNAFGDDNPASNQITDPGLPIIRTDIIKPPEPIIEKTLESNSDISGLSMEFNNLILNETTIEKSVTKTELVDNPLLCLPEWTQKLLNIPAKIEQVVTTTEKIVAPLMGIGNKLNNKIEGNSANNVLSGLVGKDILTGGQGADTFVYENGADSLPDRFDVITDFNSAQGDRINLSAIDANTAETGTQNFDFIGTTAFSKQAGQLRFDTAIQVLQGDTTGNGHANFSIQISGVSMLFVDALILHSD